jgi:hypothetical protein
MVGSLALVAAVRPPSTARPVDFFVSEDYIGLASLLLSSELGI